jgi:hypothetical protein
MEGGRVKDQPLRGTDQIRTGSLAQESALALDTPQLLEEGEGYEKHGQILLQEGHLKLLWTGNSDGPRFT